MPTTKAQFSLCTCLVWSAPLLFAVNIIPVAATGNTTLAGFCSWAGQFEAYQVMQQKAPFHDVTQNTIINPYQPSVSF